MTFKLQRDLMNMAFNMFKENCFPNRQKYQLFGSSTVAVSKKMGTSRLYLEHTLSIVTLTTGQKLAPHLSHLKHPAQTVNTVRLTAPLCLTKLGQFPKFLFHRNVSQIFWVAVSGGQRLMLPCVAAKDGWVLPLKSHWSHHGEAQAGCPESGFLQAKLRDSHQTRWFLWHFHKTPGITRSDPFPPLSSIPDSLGP